MIIYKKVKIMKITIYRGADLSNYFSNLGPRVLRADIVLINNVYQLDNIEPYNKKLDYSVNHEENVVIVMLSCCNSEVINIRISLEALRYYFNGETNYRDNGLDVVVTSELIEKKITSIISSLGKHKKLLLYKRSTIIILDIFKDLIDKSKFLSEVDLKLLSEEDHTRFFAYDWRYYIKVDRNSCNSCNKEFTFNLFRENIQRLLDGTNIETAGFKTAQKFIDVFLNV